MRVFCFAREYSRCREIRLGNFEFSGRDFGGRNSKRDTCRNSSLSCSCCSSFSRNRLFITKLLVNHALEKFILLYNILQEILSILTRECISSVFAKYTKILMPAFRKFFKYYMQFLVIYTTLSIKMLRHGLEMIPMECEY